MATTRSVERALDLLECFTSERVDLKLAELARLVDLPKPTVFRMAETLVARGYLMKDQENQNYRIGYKILSVASSFLAHVDYRLVALPHMKKIRDETNESVTIYMPVKDKGTRVCVERVQSKQPLRQVVTVGDEFPIDRGAAGKVLLAFCDFEWSKYRTSEQELLKIRELGYAISYSERDKGVTSVASPIRNNLGQTVASLSISGPSFRYESEQLQKFIDIALAASKTISCELGCPNNNK